MDTTTIKQTFDLLALAEKDTKLEHSGNYWIGPCPFCGGRDRFQIKRTPDGYLWICRKCGNGKYQDPISYMAQREKLDLRKDFKEIIKRMGYDLGLISPLPRPAVPARPLVEFPPDEWQREALAEVNRASDELLYSPEGTPARQYLVRRGFSPGTCGAWLLGSGLVYGRPAILIPHIEITSKTEKILGIKYRFIDQMAAGDKNNRYRSRIGSQFYLYGLSWISETHDTLLIVEGEFNALSLWQIAMIGTSVISFGSESIKSEQITLARALAARFLRVIVWMDNPAKCRNVTTALLHPNIEQLKSPEIDSLKFDANALLQRNLLSAFLERAISKACDNPDSELSVEA
jgi:DNA primase